MENANIFSRLENEGGTDRPAVDNFSDEVDLARPLRIYAEGSVSECEVNTDARSDGGD